MYLKILVPLGTLHLMGVDFFYSGTFLCRNFKQLPFHQTFVKNQRFFSRRKSSPLRWPAKLLSDANPAMTCTRISSTSTRISPARPARPRSILCPRHPGHSTLPIPKVDTNKTERSKSRTRIRGRSSSQIGRNIRPFKYTFFNNIFSRPNDDAILIIY